MKYFTEGITAEYEGSVEYRPDAKPKWRARVVRRVDAKCVIEEFSRESEEDAIEDAVLQFDRLFGSYGTCVWCRRDVTIDDTPVRGIKHEWWCSVACCLQEQEQSYD